MQLETGSGFKSRTVVTAVDKPRRLEWVGTLINGERASTCDARHQHMGQGVNMHMADASPFHIIDVVLCVPRIGLCP